MTTSRTTTAAKKAVRELTNLRTSERRTSAQERHRCCRCCRCCRGW